MRRDRPVSPSPANGHKPACSLAIAGRFWRGGRIFAKTPQELADCEDATISEMSAAEVLAELASNRVVGNQAKLERLAARARRLCGG